MIRIKALIWDDWNVDHIARHHVIPQEVEEACQANGLALQGHSGRLVLIGPTKDGRLLAVILALVPEQGIAVYYPVTARPAARKDDSCIANFLKEMHNGKPKNS